MLLTHVNKLLPVTLKPYDRSCGTVCSLPPSCCLHLLQCIAGAYTCTVDRCHAQTNAIY